MIIRKYGLQLIVSMGLLLIGCEPKKSGVSGTSTATSADSGKKVFSYARTSDPKTLDPHAQFDTASNLFVSSIYDRLIDYHYLKRPYQLQPSLISKMPEVSSNGLVYTFELRKGIYFHDDPAFPQGKGRELEARDVIYSLTRFADINVNTRSWFFLAGAITGLDDFREKSKSFKEKNVDYGSHKVSGMEILDRYRFRLTLTRENPLLLYALAASSAAIVPREAVEKYGSEFARHPVGTGPFMLQKYRKKQTMILVKNPQYFGKYPTDGDPGDEESGLLASAGEQLPLVDEVHIPFIQEAQPNMLKFLSGDLDWIALDRDNFVKMAFRDPSGAFHLNDDYAGKFVIYSEPGLSSVYFPINTKDKLLGANKHLRKALAYALNTEQKIDLLLNGRGVKLETPVPLPIAGSQRQVGNYGYPFSLAKAKEHLAKAGYPDGKGLPPIEMTMGSTSSTAKRTFEFLRNSFAQIGVQLKPDFKTWSAFLNAVESGDFQMAFAAWSADYPDPENFYQLFYGPNTAPGPNSSAFNHPGYNAAYEKMRFMKNGPERDKLITEMAKILRDEVPIILDYTHIAVGLVQNWVGNFKRNIMVDPPFAFIKVKDKTGSQVTEATSPAGGSQG